MKSTHIVPLLLLTCLQVSVLACATSGGTNNKGSALSVGDRARLKLDDLNGATHRLEDWAGKVVIVDFWASWCAPCKDAMPFYEELAAAHPNDLVVIGVSVDENVADLRAALQQRPVSFVVLHDASGASAEWFGVDTMPSSYLIDRQGILRQIHRGFVPSDRDSLRTRVEKLIASGP